MKRSQTLKLWLPVNLMHYLTKLAFTFTFLLGLCCLGCGGSKAPTVTSQDELTKYVEEHPESKEIEMMP